ncbi:MAG: hypothetical protein ACI9WU_002566, partial [Myxococcota bacterium]
TRGTRQPSPAVYSSRAMKSGSVVWSSANKEWSL